MIWIPVKFFISSFGILCTEPLGQEVTVNDATKKCAEFTRKKSEVSTRYQLFKIIQKKKKKKKTETRSPIQFVVRFCNTACRNFTHSTFVERKVSRRSLNPTVLRSRSTLQGVERGCVGAYPKISPASVLVFAVHHHHRRNAYFICRMY